MQKFIATSLVSFAAAQSTMGQTDYAGDDEFHARMDEKATVGQAHVDMVVEDPYSAAGVKNIHGTEECLHAIGHDGSADYVRLIPLADSEDYANCSGDYIYQEDTKLNGKHVYVNFEKDRFVGWTGAEWSLTSVDYMADIMSGEIASPFGGFHFGTGAHDRPEAFEGYTVEFEHEMDLEPEWRCLMRPLLRTAVEKVEDAELSIESKSILDEKKALIAVHERLVHEAEQRKEEASCIELIERAMARLEECELQVLRNYVQIADTYPTSWLGLLNEKTVCVDTFAKETATCNHLWEDQWGRYYG